MSETALLDALASAGQPLTSPIQFDKFQRYGGKSKPCWLKATQITESQRSELQQPNKDIERLTAVLAAVAQTENNAKAAEVLNQRGTPTARGGVWTADSVRKARLTAKNRGLG